MVVIPLEGRVGGHGLLVRRVVPGGSARRAGLRSGDVLLQYGGKKLTTPADLKEVFRGAPAWVRSPSPVLS